MFQSVIPILHVSDADAARRFYCARLGFTLSFETPPVAGSDAPRYFGITRDGFSLHLSSFPGDGVAGSAVMIQVSDVDALCAEFLARGVVIDSGPVDQTWGTREMYVKDADRNCLRFWCDL
jgi:catechol 2,3-dioxygenase-like lactoylglutathione lyase family enzyme